MGDQYLINLWRRISCFVGWHDWQLSTLFLKRICNHCEKYQKFDEYSDTWIKVDECEMKEMFES